MVSFFAPIAAGIAAGGAAGLAGGLFNNDKISTPDFSFQELEFLEQQKQALERFNSILTQEGLSAKENQDLLRNISGLFRRRELPETAGIDSEKIDKVINAVNQELTEGPINQGGLTTRLNKAGLPSSIINDFFVVEGGRTNIRGGASQTDAAAAIVARLEEAKITPDTAREFGFFDPDFDRTDFVPDEAAIQKLRTRIQNQVQATENLQNRLLNITNLSIDRQERALRGELPVSEGTRQERQRQFESLRAEANRRGLGIQGGNLDEAFASSTAGNQLINDLRSRFAAVEDAERRGEIATGFGNIAQGLNFRAAPTPTPPASLGFAQSSFGAGPGRLLNAFGTQAQLAGQAATPFTNQRMLNFQADIQNQANRQQLINSIISLGAQAGTAAAFGGLGFGGGAPKTSAGGAPIFSTQPTGNRFSRFPGVNNSTSLPGFF